MATLFRQRWYSCDRDGVPSWKLMLYNMHMGVRYTNEKGVITAKLANNREIRLDKLGRVQKSGRALYCTGFLETEKPTKGQLACFREEWEIVE